MFSLSHKKPKNVSNLSVFPLFYVLIAAIVPRTTKLQLKLERKKVGLNAMLDRGK